MENTKVLVTSFINGFLPYLPSILVIAGWIITYKFKIDEEKRSAKIRAYENTLNVLWNLNALADNGKLNNKKLYWEQGRCTELELYAPSEIISAVTKSTKVIIKLQNSPPSDLETNMVQELANDQYKRVVNLMRADLKLDLGDTDGPLTTYNSLEEI